MPVVLLRRLLGSYLAPSITRSTGAAQALLDFRHARAFEAAEHRQRFLEVLELRRLLLRAELDLHEVVDPLLQAILPDRERVQLRLRDDQGLVAVVRGDEPGERGDAELRVVARGRLGDFRVGPEPAVERIDQVEILVHLLVFDQRAAKDELRDEHERDEVCGRLGIGNQAGNNQAQRDATRGGDEHEPPIRKEHPADFEHGIADDHEERALDRAEHGERAEFGRDIMLLYGSRTSRLRSGDAG